MRSPANQMPKWTDRTRRAFLSATGAIISAIAGCAGEDESDKTTPTRTTTTSKSATSTTTPEQTPTQTTTADINRTIDLEISHTNAETAYNLQLTGTVTTPNGITSITIEVTTPTSDSTPDTTKTTNTTNTTNTTRTLTLDNPTKHTLNQTLTIEGGHTYTITVTVTEPDGTTFEEQHDTDYIPIALDSLPQPDRLVGAHYYPWYEMHAGHQHWTDSCVADPVLGEYAADNPAVIDQHLAWCLTHGIRWLSISWWGPGSGTDRALKNAILDAEHFDELQFSILYETKGRLESFDYDLDRTATRNRLIEDLQYLEQQYVTEDNYLHLDGRPVLFLYIANALKGDLQAGFNKVFDALDTRPYLLADLPTGAPPSSYEIAQVADAAADYNPYTDRKDIAEVFHDLYAQHNRVQQLGSQAIDMDYVPVVIPGFNDTAIPDSQREDNPVLPASPERYARVIEQVTPHLRDAKAVLVTSFNEWYENTEIEPNETYGTRYLELTRDELATGQSPGYDPEGTRLRLAFNKTIVPAKVNPDSEDERKLAFQLGGLRFISDGEPIASYNVGTPPTDLTFLEGAFPPEGQGEVTWRWLGGFTGETTVLVEADIDTADRAVLLGQPIRSDVIEASVFVDGVQTDHVAFGERDGAFDEYVVDLGRS